jgi:hypothetical protein
MTFILCSYKSVCHRYAQDARKRNQYLVATTTIISQQDAEETLSTLFASSARVSLLRVFLLDPQRAYYQRQLEQATGLAIRAVQRELERLVGVGLLFRHSEGNRAYHQVDMDFPLFPELRNIILKTSTTRDVLRSKLAMDPAVRLAFLHADESQVLVVSQAGHTPAVDVPGTLSLEVVSSETFLKWAEARDATLAPYLEAGSDLLGRREDVIWRRIEGHGYRVNKGEGIP